MCECSCNRDSEVDLTNQTEQLNCRRTENSQESLTLVYQKQINTLVNRYIEIVILESYREREEEKEKQIWTFLSLPSPSLYPSFVPLISHCLSIRGRQKKKEKALRQQYALLPVPQQGRQKQRNQQRAHVKSHCEDLSGGLPALAGFPRWSHCPPPPAPTNQPKPASAAVSAGRKHSFTRSHELTHIQPNWSLLLWQNFGALFSASTGTGHDAACIHQSHLKYWFPLY